MKAVEVNLSIDLTSKEQLIAYHSLLMAIGGHKVEPELILTGNPLPGKVQFFEPENEKPIEEEKPKRSRAKKVAEAPTPQEEEQEEVPATSIGISVEFFREKIALVTMEDKEALPQIKAFLIESFGTFKADQLDADQRAKAYEWLKSTFKLD